MAKYNLELNNDSHVVVSMGNIKIGKMANFNLLPTDDYLYTGKGEQICNVKGTCGSECSGCKNTCYAVKSMRRFHNTVVPSWGKNTLLLREHPEQVKEEIINFVNKKQPEIFRFHTSGDWESVEHIKLYSDICEACPSTPFYIYTKQFSLLLDYIRKGYTFPDNLVINLSEWHGNLDEFYNNSNMSDDELSIFKSFNVFSYDDHTDKCMAQKTKLIHCPAVDEKGHETGVQCSKCRRCVNHGHITAVYEH